MPRRLLFILLALAPLLCCAQSAPLRKPGVLNQVAITHCIRVVSESGRSVDAWIQDSLIPGFNADAKVDGQIEIWADLLAYAVSTDRGRNMPVMLVNRFQPK